ncbi:MAG: signal peptidase I [Chloroherpetonaceae bacterium]|nr:signal peptidase I [Chloroherpetonaceae bacterium]MCS7212096.1 signal peptidase I [Chloroherpetonaceae bacterium]MDW8020050.1 signal peptidase I [Chloroherpetonaceae bacterium]
MSASTAKAKAQKPEPQKEKKSKAGEILNGQSAKGTPTKKSKTREWIEALIFAGVAAFLLRSFVIEAYRIPTGSMEKTLLAGDFLLVNKFIYGAIVPFTNYRLPGFKQVEQGDVVVFKYPRDKDVNYIKRCVAVAGQTIEIKNRQVFVDGKEFPLPPEGQFLSPQPLPPGQAEINIFPLYSSFNKDNFGPLHIPKKGDKITLMPETFYTYKFLLEYEGHTTAMMGRQVYVDGKPTNEYVVQQNYYFMMGDNRDNSLDSRYWGFVPESHIVGSALIIYWSWDPELSLFRVFDKLASIRWSRIGRLVH